jgi:hypothetical protein
MALLEDHEEMQIPGSFGRCYALSSASVVRVYCVDEA